MKLNRKATRLLTLAQETVFPPKHAVDAREEAAQEIAVSVWRDLFQAFGALVQDADILEVGCGDGRLAARLMSHGGARSVIGIEPIAAFIQVNDDQERLLLSNELAMLDTLDDAIFDLIIARDLDGVLPIDGLERRLSRLYELLRPGGEALIRVRCGGSPTLSASTDGYGFMTPSAWASVILRAGFEIIDDVRVWKDELDRPAAETWKGLASNEETACAELRLHLVRPWESWELTALTPKVSKRRR